MATNRKAKTRKTITLKAREFERAGDALQRVHSDGTGRVVLLKGRILVVTEDDARRLEEAGAAFTYLVAHQVPDGKNVVMTIPVNG